MANILICDDEVDTSSAIAHYLEGKGHHVVQVHSVADSIEELNANQTALPGERYAVAIIDLHFNDLDPADPREGGMRILDRAVQLRFLESIILTAHASTETAADSVGKAFLYLRKVDSKNGAQAFFETLGEMVERAIKVSEQSYNMHKFLIDMGDTIHGDLCAEMPPAVRMYLSSILTQAQMNSLALIARRQHQGGGR